MPVMGVSITRDPATAERMLADGLVDLVAMGRSWLADPDWGVKAIAGRDDEITRCIGCLYCTDDLLGGGHVVCAVNPRCGFESVYPMRPARDAVAAGYRAGLEV